LTGPAAASIVRVCRQAGRDSFVRNELRSVRLKLQAGGTQAVENTLRGAGQDGRALAVASDSKLSRDGSLDSHFRTANDSAGAVPSARRWQFPTTFGIAPAASALPLT
jgi:hypothetical protein